VVVHYANRLQERINDSGAHERKAAALEVFADAIGQLRCGMEVAESSRVIDDPGSTDPVP
jgi:hypothetical protein